MYSNEVPGGVTRNVYITTATCDDVRHIQVGPVGSRVSPTVSLFPPTSPLRPFSYLWLARSVLLVHILKDEYR